MCWPWLSSDLHKYMLNRNIPRTVRRQQIYLLLAIYSKIPELFSQKSNQMCLVIFLWKENSPESTDYTGKRLFWPHLIWRTLSPFQIKYTRICFSWIDSKWKCLKTCGLRMNSPFHVLHIKVSVLRNRRKAKVQIAQLFSFVHLAKIILYNIELEIRKSYKHLLNLTVFPNRVAEQQKSCLKSLEITDTVTAIVCTQRDRE